MLDLLPIAIGLGVGALGLLLFNQRLLYKDNVKNFTPFMQKRIARHPDGQNSSIEYDYFNHNGKHMWKFNEWDNEVHAESPYDVIIEPGAEYGNAFYIFRCNRDGTEGEWQNPEYRRYFAVQKRAVKNSDKGFFDKLSTEDFDEYIRDTEKVSRTMDLDDKYAEALIKKLKDEEREEGEKEDKKEKKEEKK